MRDHGGVTYGSYCDGHGNKIRWGAVPPAADAASDAPPPAAPLQISIPSPTLLALIRAAADRHCRTPRLLVLEILDKVFVPQDGHDLVAAILDEG